MKNTMKLVLLLLLFANMAIAQKTGSFNENITFMNEQRTLSLFVPADYDSTVKYRLMVALHGMGDNSNNMRNALSSSSGGFTTYMPNTIMVCPDGGSDPYKSFNIPEGDEEIIQEAIDYAAAHYNIDESAIILEGFSLGGAHSAAIRAGAPGKIQRIAAAYTGGTGRKRIKSSEKGV